MQRFAYTSMVICLAFIAGYFGKYFLQQQPETTDGKGSAQAHNRAATDPPVLKSTQSGSPMMPPSNAAVQSATEMLDKENLPPREPYAIFQPEFPVSAGQEPSDDNHAERMEYRNLYFQTLSEQMRQMRQQQPEIAPPSDLPGSDSAGETEENYDLGLDAGPPAIESERSDPFAETE